MTSSLEGAKKLVTRGTDIGARIEGLDAATQAARGRLDDALVDEAQAVVDRATGRLRLSATPHGRRASPAPPGPASPRRSTR